MKSQLTIAFALMIVMSLSRAMLADCSETEVCSTNNPKACVCLDNSSDQPDENIEFSFTANNGIDLLIGRDESDTLLQWRVWAEDSAGGTADLGPVRTPASDDFDVKILDDGGGPGCLDVAKIELDPTGSGDFSNLSGIYISGDVNGVIFLQEDGGGNGGVASGTNIIAGTVSGNVTVPHLTGYLLISINMDGDVDVTDIGTAGLFSLSGSIPSGTRTLTFGNIVGDLYVGGSVAGDATIEIQDLGDASDGGSVNINGAYMTGTLLLTTGIDNSAAEVNVAYPKGVIDLNGYDVAGRLEVGFPYTSAQIVHGGQVTSTGKVTYGLLQGFDPEGSATFASVAAGGEIKVDNDVNLKGHITITGDMDGSITLTNDLESFYGGASNYGAIDVGGDLGGAISIQGDVTDYAQINLNSMSGTGTLSVDGACDGDIDIAGSTTVNTRVHCKSSLGSTGSIIEEYGDSDFAGSVIIGSLSGDPIEGDYDGCIDINSNFTGRIRVAVCDENDSDDYNICATGSGTIQIANSTCTNQPSYSCSTCTP